MSDPCASVFLLSVKCKRFMHNHVFITFIQMLYCLKTLYENTVYAISVRLSADITYFLNHVQCFGIFNSNLLVPLFLHLE